MPNNNNNSIYVNDLSKRYNNQEIFDDLSFEVSDGEIIALLGPNGCGKSTILNILSGIVPHDGGEFHIEDFNPFRFSYIFQDYRESLLHWRNNFDNIILPLEIQKQSKEVIAEQIKELQQVFEFKFDLYGYPYELSGGQQQILAFLRALIIKPKLLFIDEAFSALDYENNLFLRGKLQEYYIKEKPTILLISHNIEEAMHLASKVILFSQRPARIIEVIANPLPYPRTIETLKSREFHEIRDQVLSVFQKAVNL